MKPLIGITACYTSKTKEANRTGQDRISCSIDYPESIKNAGGVPVLVPVIEDEEYIDELVKKLDGVLFSGGADIYPLYYGQVVKRKLGDVVIKRDDFEYMLMGKAIKYNKPILGICRGLQLINVFFNGTLYQDVFEENIAKQEHVGTMLSRDMVCHNVKLKKDSILHKAIGIEEIGVNSFHHQAVDKLGDGLVVTATSEDNIIEGFEHEEYSCVFGVQWHPEMMASSNDIQQKIFNYFVGEIRNKTVEREI
ncbi:gamma-glutamyl-gamma-aminobutyrate hydrolase family protein [Clostridiaceae bacterium M8S5]|nr:gamma-glutamyl-gamma-aminobutyrate hydrolase family protein [Clostridiaceae bacterium M8S5]